MNHDCNGMQIKWSCNSLILEPHICYCINTSYCSIDLGKHGVNGAQSSYYNLNGFVTTDYQIMMYHTEFNNDLITKLSTIN
jgi:hypothetical protein